MPAKFSYHRRYLTGLTLIEIMLAILVLAVMVIGTAGYRYYSELDARKAVKQANAARIALTLLENWRGRIGNTDSATLAALTVGLTDVGATGQTLPTGYTQFGNCYQAQLDGVNYYLTMSYNPTIKSGLKVLHVAIVWPISINETTYYNVFTLETYAGN